MSANYWASTQCNNWLLDRPQLFLSRREDLLYSTPLECCAISVFFSSLISTICKHLNLRQRVVASACVFFHRFFSKNSFSALDPFLVSATCVYVAAKVEESPIHIKSAVAEATRYFQEVGYRGMPSDNSSLAEMEFYLLEEIEFDMVLFHPYRSLIALYDSFGTGNSKDTAGEFGVIKGLTSVEEKEAQEAMEGGEGERLREFDENVLQMAWFVLNDTYKTPLTLMYPPYLVAVAAVYLALTLHAPAFEKVNASLSAAQTQRAKHAEAVEAILNNPTATSTDLTKALELNAGGGGGGDALTFFAKLNISLPLLGEVVQEMVGGYQMQNEVSRLVSDGVGMVKLLERMRESRRVELLRRSKSERESAAQR